jgi:PAS domain S-box-containing protein
MAVNAAANPNHLPREIGKLVEFALAAGDLCRRTSACRYGQAVLAAAAAAAARQLLEARFGSEPPYITFYPAMMLAAIIGGFGPGLLTTLLTACYADYFVLAPRGHFAISDPGEAIGLAIFCLMGLAVSSFAGVSLRLKDRERTLSDQALRDSEQRFQTVVEGMDDYAIFMLDAEGRIASWNAGAQRINGWSAGEIIGQDLSVLFEPEAIRNGTPRQLLEIAAAQGSFRGEAVRVRKNGSHFWADTIVTARRDKHGVLNGYIELVRDITERKQAVRDVTESRSRLATIIESAMDAVITTDSEQRIVLFNAAAVAMFGVPLAEMLGMPLERLIPQRFREAHASYVQTFAEAGVTSRAMGQLGTLSGLRSNGEEFPIEASISNAYVEGSRLFTVIVRDITQRKRAEEHQSLLLAELAHRVKNTLAVVQSITVQTRRFAPPEQFFDRFNGRLDALGNAHDLLTRSAWEGAALADLVSFGFQPYDISGGPQRWSVNGPALWLAPNEALTLSLAFHELATNAAKYGALSDGNGTVAVCWRLQPDGAPNAVAIHWAESGGPPVTTPTRRGFGSRLLDEAIPHELDGETSLEFRASGVECWLRFPLSSRVKIHE